MMVPGGLRGCKNRPAPFPGRMSYKSAEVSLENINKVCSTVAPRYAAVLAFSSAISRSLDRGLLTARLAMLSVLRCTRSADHYVTPTAVAEVAGGRL